MAEEKPTVEIAVGEMTLPSGKKYRFKNFRLFADTGEIEPEPPDLPKITCVIGKARPGEAVTTVRLLHADYMRPGDLVMAREGRLRAPRVGDTPDGVLSETAELEEGRLIVVISGRSMTLAPGAPYETKDERP